MEKQMVAICYFLRSGLQAPLRSHAIGRLCGRPMTAPAENANFRRLLKSG
jgi:hypothetical protein